MAIEPTLLNPYLAGLTPVRRMKLWWKLTFNHIFRGEGVSISFQIKPNLWQTKGEPDNRFIDVVPALSAPARADGRTLPKLKDACPKLSSIIWKSNCAAWDMFGLSRGLQNYSTSYAFLSRIDPFLCLFCQPWKCQIATGNGRWDYTLLKPFRDMEELIEWLLGKRSCLQKACQRKLFCVYKKTLFQVMNHITTTLRPELS